MAITITWNTGRIFIPKSFLSLVSGTLYDLDTNVFRLALKALEETPEGMPWPDTHRHNTEVTVAGTTYARSVEIINGYTVEFEDGQYTVRLVGSNNNIFDVEGGILVRNQVQVIPTNSAGLVVTAHELAAAAAAVWDVVASEHITPGTTGRKLADVWQNQF